MLRFIFIITCFLVYQFSLAVTVERNTKPYGLTRLPSLILSGNRLVENAADRHIGYGRLMSPWFEFSAGHAIYQAAERVFTPAVQNTGSVVLGLNNRATDNITLATGFYYSYSSLDNSYTEIDSKIVGAIVTSQFNLSENYYFKLSSMASILETKQNRTSFNTEQYSKSTGESYRLSSALHMKVINTDIVKASIMAGAAYSHISSYSSKEDDIGGNGLKINQGDYNSIKAVSGVSVETMLSNFFIVTNVNFDKELMDYRAVVKSVSLSLPAGDIITKGEKNNGYTLSADSSIVIPLTGLSMIDFGYTADITHFRLGHTVHLGAKVYF